MEWHIVEQNIQNEIIFLKENIITSPFKQPDPITCTDCLWRLLAASLAMGKIKINKIIYTDDSIWHKNINIHPLKDSTDKEHGKLWHHSKMQLIKKYFSDNNFEVIEEQPLFYGRCDLGIPQLNIFIEVGSINLYKLYLNIFKMTNCTILIVPADDYLLEISL